MWSYFNTFEIIWEKTGGKKIDFLRKMPPPPCPCRAAAANEMYAN